MQEQEVTDKISEVVTEDIWGSIKEFLDFGFHLGEGENAVHLTIGIVLLLILSITSASLLIMLLISSYFL